MTQSKTQPRMRCCKVCERELNQAYCERCGVYTMTEEEELAEAKAHDDVIDVERRIAAATDKMRKDNDYRRACLIETIVCRDYLDEDTDAADLALDEIRSNPDRTDDAIAHAVASRISYP